MWGPAGPSGGTGGVGNKGEKGQKGVKGEPSTVAGHNWTLPGPLQDPPPETQQGHCRKCGFWRER